MKTDLRFGPDSFPTSRWIAFCQVSAQAAPLPGSIAVPIH